jgi:ParB-like chromosome segregation protein Spo0J
MSHTERPVMTAVNIIEVDPTSLKFLPTKNPNVMDPEIARALEASIRTDGFLQPVLIVEEKGEYILIDGVHRTQAAVSVGLPEIPAVVAPDRERAEILRIALNKMRGELDVSEVSRQFQLLLDTGFDKTDLEMTGFQEWEIETMLEGFDFDEDAELAGTPISPVQPEKPKTYALNFKFATESERARVKETLEEHGEGNVLEGLLAIIDQADTVGD